MLTKSATICRRLFAKLRTTPGRILTGMVVVFAFYLTSYIPNSMSGGWIVSESGNNRIISVVAVADELEWQPRFGYFHRMTSVSGGLLVRSDTLGKFYAPLILIDQKWWHSTISFMTGGEIDESFPVPPYDDYHPTKSNRFEGRWPYDESPDRSDAKISE